MAALQGKFYAHTAVDKDLKHCPPPQRLDGQPPSTAPVRLSPGANRTLASRTDVVVCEPPRRLGAAPSDAAAPRKREPRPAPAAPAGPAPSPPAAAPSPPRPACEPAASTPPPVVEAVEDGFVVTLGPFPGVGRAADLDLTAHADELVVAGAALADPIRVVLERPVDPTRVKAKWKKLDRTLRVELKAK